MQVTPNDAAARPSPQTDATPTQAGLASLEVSQNPAKAAHGRVFGMESHHIQALGVLIAAFVALGAVVDYFQKREESRAEQTLELVQTWEEKGYKASFDAIAAGIAARIDKMSDEDRTDLAKANEALWASARSQIASNVVSRTLGDRPGSAHVDSVVYFFTRLVICVDAGLCSRAASEAYFRDMARSFWSYFGEHIVERRRDAYPTYGVELQRFARR